MTRTDREIRDLFEARVAVAYRELISGDRKFLLALCACTEADSVRTLLQARFAKIRERAERETREILAGVRQTND